MTPAKFLSCLAVILVMLSCGAVATITPAKYKIAIKGTGIFSDVVHYVWIDSDTILILTRTEGQVDIIATTPNEVTIERVQQ